MILEEKAETAIINHLKSSKLLEGVGFSQHFSEDFKEGQIVVTATRGEEVAAPSGVFEIECSISLRLRLKRWSNSTAKINELAKAIEELISVPELNEHLTRNTDHFHCYFAEITPAEREAQDGKFYEHKFNLTIEAMPQDFQTAEQLSERNLTPA